MSSRFTVDTMYLKIRDVFAFNANSGEVIQRDSVPVIGDAGHVDWKNSLEFISTLSIPTLSTTVLGMLSMIQPGLSSLSTIYFSTTASFITSTSQGLGSLPNGNDYISSSKLSYIIDRLSPTYISSTTLYDCISGLGDLRNLNTIGSILQTGSNFDKRGYVSTLNPGEYKIYQSTLRLQGANLVDTSIITDQKLTITTIDIGGYIPHIVNSSKMRIDINTNMNITHVTSIPRILTNFLTLNNVSIGSQVVVNYTATSLNLPSMTFIIKKSDLTTSLNTSLILKCFINSEGTVTTLIPTIGGIHITLDNTD